MSELTGKTALVTGGSRGLGRGIVEALAAQGVKVWTIARDAGRLAQLKHDLPSVETLAGDITDPHMAEHSLREIRPDILVLNAGATAKQGPVYDQTWEQFSQVWETDVKATFQFGREALLMPMVPGSAVVIMSSGAAVGGSPLSGGYASGKRAQWFLALYMQHESNRLKLGIRFVALLPMQIIGVTDMGHIASTTYANQAGISKAEFLERMGAPLTPLAVGQSVVSLVADNAYHDGIAYGISSKGLASLN